MPVRKTESRLPGGFSAEDLGQAVTGTDGKAVLLSFNPNPIVVNRWQAYTVFVTDTALAAQVSSYDWTIQNGDTPVTSTTQVGYHTFKPELEINTTVKVELKGSAAQVLYTLQMELTVVPSNPELETLYAQTDQPAPLAGQPDVSREIINDLRAYMDELAPRAADAGSSMNRLIFSIAYIEVMGQGAQQRNASLEEIANAFQANDASGFIERANIGIGVCQVRPHILGMYLPQTSNGTDWYLPKRQYPAAETERLNTTRELLNALAALPQDKQIDLFNLLRFPKSNLKMAIQLLNGLKAQYFAADSLEAIINDKAKAQSLFNQFKKGPLS